MRPERFRLNPNGKSRFMKYTILLLLALTTAGTALSQESYTRFAHPIVTDTNGWDQKEPEIEPFLALSDDELRACVPFQAPRIYSHCPNCSQKSNGRDYSRRHFPADYNFDPKKPYLIECKKCKETFPNNPRFPQDHTSEKLAPKMWFDTPQGDFVTIRWHQQTRKRDPKTLKPGDNPEWIAYFYMDGALDTNRDRFCQDAMKTLTKGYWYYREKDPELAYRCAWKVSVLLDAYADALPRWLLCDNYGKDYYDCRTKDDFPYGWSETRYGTARQTSEANGPGFFVHAMDVVCESKAFKDYGRQHRPSYYETLFVRDGETAVPYNLTFFDKLVRNALKPVRRFQTSGLGKTEQGAPILGSQSFAKLTHNRELLRLMMQSMEVFPKAYYVDGGFGQGPGYSGITLNAAETAMQSLRGYTDPPGYTPPANSPNKAKWESSYFPEDMPHLGPITKFYSAAPGKLETFWGRAFQFWHDLEMPNGGVWPFNESNHRNMGSARHLVGPPHHTTKTVFKTGLKRLVLADGEGDDQIALNLGFGRDTKHGHRDYMDLLIFDNGHFLADDFGYGKHQMRARYSSYQVHNTAMIDTERAPSNNGRPLLFHNATPGVSIMRAGTPTTEYVEQYERTVALISTDIKHPYVLDLFYIKGKGDPNLVKRREYVMHTTKYHEQTASTSLPLKKLPGERALLAREGIEWKEDMLNNKGYGVFFDVQAAPANGYFTVDFKVTDPWKPIMWSFDPKRGSPPVEIKGKTPTACLPYKDRDDSYADKPAIGIRRHFLGSEGQEAFLFNMPHPQKLHANKHSDGWGRMPAFIVRHDVEDTSDATAFLVVHEGWQNKPYIQKLSRLPAEHGSPNAIALTVQMPDRVDFIFLSTDNKPASYVAGGIRFNGRFGFVSRSRTGTDGLLIGGKQLSHKEAGIDYSLPTDVYEGHVTGSIRKWRGAQADGLIVDQKLPRSLVGSWIMVNVNGVSLPRNPQEKDVEAFESKPEGGGWAFKIAAITEREGKTLIETENDHGLEVSEKTCREFFHPQMHIKGSTRFQIHPATANQTLVDVTPAGGPLQGPTKVTMTSQSAERGARIEYLTVPLDAPPVYSVSDDSLKWTTYEKPLTIETSSRLLVRARPKNGIKTPTAQRLEFTMAPEQAKGVTSDTLKPLPVLVDRYHKYKHDKLIGIRIAEKPHPALPYTGFDQRDTGHYRHSLGLLHVKSPGLYTFFYRPKRSGALVIGGQKVVSGSFPIAMTGQCYLKPGYYEFRLINEGSNKFDLEWQGPGIPRRRLDETELLHRPEELAASIHEFQTQKELR